MPRTSRASATRPGARARLKAFLSVAALAVSLVPAHAGDLAHRAIIGFSPSGKHFAFEEFGVQDGSGFPYASIYIVNTQNDSWVSGTPIRVMDEEVEGAVEHVRDEAMEDAAAILDAAQISEPGNHVASNPVTELGSDPHKVTVNPRYTVRPIGDPVTVSLKEFPLPGQDICKDWGETKGFALTVEQGGKERTLHEDKAIPESRGCALSYRIADVLTHHPDDGPPVIAILLLYEKVGFEGPDGRWLAVTARLD